MSFDDRVSRLAPHVLSLMRIVVALLFLEHGSAKLLGFPANGPIRELFTLSWFSGAIELIGGALLAAGLFSRTAAFIMSGEMAFAYFMSHAPQNFFPLINRGDAAVLYCFIFFYFAFAGPGPWSLDAWCNARGKRTALKPAE
jgi:putative oxidoreductase